MSALALEVLGHVEATGNVRLVRDGDVVRILARPGTDVGEVTARIRDLKPLLYEALLQREIMSIAHGPTDAFNRRRFNELFTLWRERYGIPWDGPADLSPELSLSQTVSSLELEGE